VGLVSGIVLMLVFAAGRFSRRRKEYQGPFGPGYGTDRKEIRPGTGIPSKDAAAGRKKGDKGGPPGMGKQEERWRRKRPPGEGKPEGQPPGETVILTEMDTEIVELEKVEFPQVIKCPECDAEINLPRAGTFRCPHCKGVNKMDEFGIMGKKVIPPYNVGRKDFPDIPLSGPETAEKGD
jgi:hypothetical protein